MEHDAIKKLRFLDNKPRKKQILLILLRADYYLTSQTLATELHVTSRTIKKELKELREDLHFLGIILESKRSLGYLLKIPDKILENKIKNHFKIYGSINYENECQHRVNYILRFLLSSSNHIKINDIQTRLFLNIPLSKELEIVKNILDKYSLKLISKPHYGMKIEGDNFKKIMLTVRMYRYFDKDASYNFGISEFNLLFECDANKKQQIRQTIFKTLINSRIVFSDINVERFIIFLIYFKNKKISNDVIYFEMPQVDFNYKLTDEFLFVEEVLNKLRTKFDAFEFTSETVRFLTYIAIFSSDLYRFIDCSEKNYHQLIRLAEKLRNFILSNASLLFGVDLFDDYTCMKDLLKIMIPISLKVLLCVSDSIDLRYNDFKSPTRYPIIYSFMKIIYAQFELEFNYTFSNREEYLIFITICGVINRIYLDHKKLNIAIIAIDGRLSTQQLKFNLQTYFSDLIERIDTKLLYELEINTKKNYDLFVCFNYAKKLGIKCQPITYIDEEMDDLYFKSVLQKQFNKAYYYDNVLPKIEITYNNFSNEDSGNKNILDNELSKNPSAHYILLNKHIILNLKGQHEFFKITRYTNSDNNTVDIFNMSVILDGDKQKFKMILNILENINITPNKLDFFLNNRVESLSYSEFLG